jgi:hypothetical protein
MNRILFAGILAAFLVWQPGSSPLAQDKGSTGWKSVEDFKVLKLWEDRSLGPTEPQIAILQLFSADRQKELQCDPLAFYKKYNIFVPSESDFSKGQFVIKLVDYKGGASKPAAGDPYVVMVIHDSHTYSAAASVEVDEIK